jgi:hypothetical protein
LWDLEDETARNNHEGQWAVIEDMGIIRIAGIYIGHTEESFREEITIGNWFAEAVCAIDPQYVGLMWPWYMPIISVVTCH